MNDDFRTAGIGRFSNGLAARDPVQIFEFLRYELLLAADHLVVNRDEFGGRLHADRSVQRLLSWRRLVHLLLHILRQNKQVLVLRGALILHHLLFLEVRDGDYRQQHLILD